MEEWENECDVCCCQEAKYEYQYYEFSMLRIICQDCLDQYFDENRTGLYYLRLIEDIEVETKFDWLKDGF